MIDNVVPMHMKRRITIEIDDELSGAITRLAMAAAEDEAFGAKPAGRLARALWDAMTQASTVDA